MYKALTTPTYIYLLLSAKCRFGRPIGAATFACKSSVASSRPKLLNRIEAPRLPGRVLQELVNTSGRLSNMLSFFAKTRGRNRPTPSTLASIQDHVDAVTGPFLAECGQTHERLIKFRSLGQEFRSRANLVPQRSRYTLDRFANRCHKTCSLPLSHEAKFHRKRQRGFSHVCRAYIRLRVVREQDFCMKGLIAS